MEGQSKPIQLPSIQAVVSSFGLYPDYKTSCGNLVRVGTVSNNLCSGYSRDRVTASRPCDSCNTPVEPTPTQEIEFLAFSVNYTKMELKLPVDLFANRLKPQLPIYASWRPDPMAVTTDVFSTNWAELRGCQFPCLHVPSTCNCTSLRTATSAKPPSHQCSRKVDGYRVGQHPLVSWTLRGTFYERPPQPRYSEMWNVATVTTYMYIVITQEC